MGSSQKERMIPMLKKLTALFLSLLLCLSLLPGQAGAMDASEDEQPVQAEAMENLGSSENGGADAAPCTVVSASEGGRGNRGAPPVNIPIKAGNGRDYGPTP